MMLLIAEIREGLPVPDFGSEYQNYMSEKHHAGYRSASLCAWTLLREALCSMGFHAMPDVTFSETGKPSFRDHCAHFSLSHSGKLAVALVSDENCAVDVEKIDPNAAEKLSARCMHENEIAAGMDFFECWTKKECIGKLSGNGLPSKPGRIDLTACREAFFTACLSDSCGEKYYLSALAHEKGELKVKRIEL